MSLRNKSRNILFSLRDRELSSRVEPYKLSLNILSQLIRSDQSFYKFNYNDMSSKPITYDFGFLYYNNHSSTYTLYGKACEPRKAHTLKPENATKKVVDVITYNTPVSKTFENCKCKYSRCSCASGFVLCLTDDSWLCQYNLKTGALMKEVYVKRNKANFKFKYCDWDEYATRVILTSGLNCDEVHPSKSDIVVNLAVFNVFPLEFSALLEIKRSVFGKSCKHVNIDDQLLILGMGYDRVHIYSFLDVLAEGNLSPYKIGEKYGDLGEVGMYPTGLPLNFNIEFAPPLLFDVQCFGQSVCFGGFPYHCIYPKPKDQLKFVIQNMQGDGSKKTYIDSNVWNDEPNVVTFHPDRSNRIILRELSRVSVYDIKYIDDKLQLKKSYCIDFKRTEFEKVIPQVNSFGRRIYKDNFRPRNRFLDNMFLDDRNIMAIAYEDELNILGVLGFCVEDADQNGYVYLYDSVTGEKIKFVRLCQILCETNYYQLDIDREMLIIIEKDTKNLFKVYAYQLANIYHQCPEVNNIRKLKFI